VQRKAPESIDIDAPENDDDVSSPLPCFKSRLSARFGASKECTPLNCASPLERAAASSPSDLAKQSTTLELPKITPRHNSLSRQMLDGIHWDGVLEGCASPVRRPRRLQKENSGDVSNSPDKARPEDTADSPDRSRQRKVLQGVIPDIHKNAHRLSASAMFGVVKDDVLDDSSSPTKVAEVHLSDTVPDIVAARLPPVRLDFGSPEDSRSDIESGTHPDVSRSMESTPPQKISRRNRMVRKAICTDARKGHQPSNWVVTPPRHRKPIAPRRKFNRAGTSSAEKSRSRGDLDDDDRSFMLSLLKEWTLHCTNYKPELLVHRTTLQSFLTSFLGSHNRLAIQIGMESYSKLHEQGDTAVGVPLDLIHQVIEDVQNSMPPGALKEIVANRHFACEGNSSLLARALKSMSDTPLPVSQTKIVPWMPV
jgi:hypothetical protein